MRSSALVDLSNLLSSRLISFFSTMTDLGGGPQGGRRLKERGTEGVGLRDDSVQKSDSFERVGSFGQFVSNGSKLVQSRHVFLRDLVKIYLCWCDKIVVRIRVNISVYSPISLYFDTCWRSSNFCRFNLCC